MTEPLAAESRLSTAAQFFMEATEDTAVTSTSTYDRVVELINQASLLQKDSQKVSNLKQVQELIINKDPNLLDNFLDEVLAFQTDRSVDVKKFVVGFMEEACKKDPDLLTKVLPCLQLLLQDENVNVQKKVILSLSGIYKSLILWLSKSKSVTGEMAQAWEAMNQMKTTLYDMLDSENDGIRTHAVKFVEGIVLTLSWKTSESEIPKTLKPENDICLNIIPETGKFLRVKKLEEEGKKMFDALLQFQASPHISSINLMTVMGSITNIAKQRPSFFGRVVQSFETLHVNLPPTLAKSQVSSVRKNLKMQMLSLLKHPCSPDYLSNITTLLTDLGATQTEVMKSMPKIDESKKRKIEEPSQASSKKQRIETEVEPLIDDDDDIGMTPWSSGQDKRLASARLRQTAIDITSEDLIPRMTSTNVADLVLISMVMLPETLPPHFQATYTPIAAAGTEGQIKHMSRLLATQLTMAGMGEGIAEIQRQQAEEDAKKVPDTPTHDSGTSPKQLIQTLVGGTTGLEKEKKKLDYMPPPNLPMRRGVKHFKLSHVTKRQDRDTLDSLTIQSVNRILNADKAASDGNVLPARTKLLSFLVAQFGGGLKNVLQEFIFEDLRNRSDLAFCWLYQEYANCQGFSISSEGDKVTMGSYDECLTRLLNGLLEKTEQREAHVLFHRLLLEAPAITDNAMLTLKKFCMDESRVVAGLTTLRTLIMTRPAHRLRFLDCMLEFCSNDRLELRTSAIKFTKGLYEHPEIHDAIEHYAIQMLKNLLNPHPALEVFQKLKSKQIEIPDGWSEEAIKMCLYLYLGLLPSNHKLIHELSTVYTATSADIKRTILRMLEAPVKGMGMRSPELLKFVEDCPKGAETLVTRVIHILTDKAAPSPDLVERVRDLYHKRVPDVRFLIPVLTGLQKKEVIGALPKLIKLNPIVVKEVFNRLLGGHGEATYTSPLTPAELLIALHSVDTTKCDMKTIIKATNLCFSEKKVYTQEVLALVMQNLMEQNPLPTLFMRTVLQSLSMWPRLLGLVMNIMNRLIEKQVWKQKKVWEGFVRCCQRTKPQSFQLLLRLPQTQLKNVFEIAPDLREPLLHHVNSFTPVQKAHIPSMVIQILETDPVLEQQRLQQEKDAAERREAEEKLRKEREAQELLRQKIEAEERLRMRRDEEDRERSRKEAEMRLNQKLEEEKRRMDKQKQEQRRADSAQRLGVKHEPSDTVIKIEPRRDFTEEHTPMTIDLSVVKSEPKDDYIYGTSRVKEEPMEISDSLGSEDRAGASGSSRPQGRERESSSKDRSARVKSSRSSSSSSRKSSRTRK